MCLLDNVSNYFNVSVLIIIIRSGHLCYTGQIKPQSLRSVHFCCFILEKLNRLKNNTFQGSYINKRATGPPVKPVVSLGFHSQLTAQADIVSCSCS